jgi:cysteine synthase
MIITNILSYIGNTPLYKLNESVYVKCELFNPGGSIKDRIALAMIEDAEASGLLNKDMVIMEPTSGNTGIGIALVGKLKGYKVKIVMPENMSIERRMLIEILGGEVVLTPAQDSIKGAVDYACRYKERNPGTFVPNQFENKANPKVHYDTTAPELWDQLSGKIDYFISGIGSGGTIQGIGTFLKERNPKIKIIAVEPKNASAILGHEPGLHQIQGIGDGFIPQILELSILDDVIEVSDDDAIETTRLISNEHGLLAGISSGANVWAAMKLHKSVKGNIVTILADRAERYFSTSLMKGPVVSN